MKSTFSFKSLVVITLVAFVAAFAGNQALAQNASGISGRVIDSKGEAIIGAFVVEQGSTSNGASTDLDGKFEIRVAPGTNLEVSCIGYTTKLVSASAGMTVVLEDDSLMLEETVVVGYGTMKKSDVTGAMVSVKAEDLVSRPTNNVFEALQGRAAGVDIRTSERPGEVGAVYIRGQRSLNASSNPLYVVDGIPMLNGGLESFNPNDIESIEVLKDASATAIYGSRGANGVVLVTTKKGKEGTLNVSYAGSVTVEKLVDNATWMTSGEYIDWRRNAYYNLNPNSYPSPTSPTYDNDYRIFNGGADPYAWRNIAKGWSADKTTWDGSKVETTDWMSIILKPAVTQEHTVSVSGGTDKLQSYMSLGYLKNDGTMRGQGYERFTVKANNDFTPAKWLKLGTNINATYSIQNYGLSGAGNFQGGSQASVYGVATQNYPYAVPYDDNGNRIEFPGGDDRVKNPVGEWDYQTDIRKTLRVTGAMYLQLDFGKMWKPLEGLSYRFNFGPDFTFADRGLFVDAKSFNRAGANYALNTKTQKFSWTLDNLIYYNRSFGKHTVGVTLLQTASAYDYRDMSMDAENLPIPGALWNNMGSVAALRKYSTSLVQSQMESYMARVNYSFADRYMITASVRADGASQLAEGHKWATFPSVALGWRIDKESFMENVSWLDQLKLRVGYGITGNAAIDPYKTKGAIAGLYYPFGSAATQGYVGYDPMLMASSVRDLPMANKELTWEKTTQYNAGIDFGFFGGRVSGVFDIYKSYTNGLLMKQSLPALIGYTTTYNNIGKSENFGFDITLNLIPVKTRDWEWSVNINAAYTKSKIVELSNGLEDDINNNWFIGQPIGVIYSYESLGLWQASDAEEMAKFNANGNHFEPGMARPKDQNGDHKIDAYDRVILGNTMPLWTMGINTGVAYKNWSLDVQLYGRFGYIDWGDAPWVGGRYNVRKYDYWTEQNTDAKYTKPIYDEAGKDIYYQIVDIADRSYLKVRNISLSYTFPSSMLKGTSISNLRLYLQAKNLGNLFNGSEVRDMDTNQMYFNRGVTFGANITF